MDTLNPLENLNLLEKKVSVLIDLLKSERALTKQLTEDKDDLVERLQALENSLLKETKSMEQLNQERVLTKKLVDELIDNIDKLVAEQTV